MINYNIATDVNETTFEDLKDLQEITSVEQIHKALGDVILLDRFAKNFDYLYNKVVDVAALCWHNRGEDGRKLQFTFIKFKKFINCFQISIKT